MDEKEGKMGERSERNKDGRSRLAFTKVQFIVALFVVTLLLFGSLLIFASGNRERVFGNNRLQLLENTQKLAEIIDEEITKGYSNIDIISELVSSSLTSPEFDISSIQHLLRDSVFDFMEFADKDGMDHNITGGVSDARDRKYYLDAKEGNSGTELIYNSRATHETLLMFYHPIYFEEEFVGSLVGVYQASNRITRLLTDTFFGFNVTSYLAEEDGRIIASSDGFDPQKEMYITDLTGGINKDNEEIMRSVRAGEATAIALPDSYVGGCVVKLEKSGYIMLRVFPEEATTLIVSRSSGRVFCLIAFIVVVFLAFLLYLVKTFFYVQKEIEKARDEAEKANAAKTVFLFNMSHDIRTPMNALLGYAHLMKSELKDPKLLEYQGKIEQSGNLLLSIINNVLDVARIESGKMEINETPINVYDLVPELLCVFKEDSEKKNIKLEYDLSVTHSYIYCDSLKVKEILLNLISNAIKYTPSGGTVSVKCTELPSDRVGYGNMRVDVSDTGIGMKKEFIPKLFDSFAREHNTTTGRVPGTGLGMTIVKKLVDLMGGTIEVESELGKGSHFSFEIPHRIAEETGSEKGEALVEIKEKGILKGKRILLAEDNDLNAEIAEAILSEEGIEVERAENGRVCVEMLEEKEAGYYDLILMDVQMPEMNGYEATRAIRDLGDNRKAEIVILAMTANAFEEDKKAAIEAGMDGHLGKPIEIDELLKALSLAFK